MTTIVLTRGAAAKDRSLPRSSGPPARVGTFMSQPEYPVLNGTVRQILDGHHLSVLATTNLDGQPQTSVIFVMRDGDTILFSTIKGRRKTTNMLRDPRVNLLVHVLPIGGTSSPYATISGTAELTEDP